MVRLNHMCLATRCPARLDKIRINRALARKLTFLFFRFGVENFDKGIADDLALRFRISHSFQAAQESLTRVDFDDVDIKGIVRSMGHHVHDLIGLFKPQQTVIDKDTRQLIADGSCEQCRHNRRVYPSGKTQYDVLSPTWARTRLTMSSTI